MIQSTLADQAPRSGLQHMMRLDLLVVPKPSGAIGANLAAALDTVVVMGVADRGAQHIRHVGSNGVRSKVKARTALNQFPCEESPVSDALTYADQTVSPTGQPVSLDERIAEMLARRGPDSPHARVHPQREPYLRNAVARVTQRLAEGQRRRAG